MTGFIVQNLSTVQAEYWLNLNEIPDHLFTNDSQTKSDDVESEDSLESSEEEVSNVIQL